MSPCPRPKPRPNPEAAKPPRARKRPHQKSPPTPPPAPPMPPKGPPTVMESSVALPLRGTALRPSPGVGAVFLARWDGRRGCEGAGGAPAARRRPAYAPKMRPAPPPPRPVKRARSTVRLTKRPVKRARSTVRSNARSNGAPSKLVMTATPGLERPAALPTAASVVSKNAASSLFWATLVNASYSAPWFCELRGRGVCLLLVLMPSCWWWWWRRCGGGGCGCCWLACCCRSGCVCV